MKNIKLKKRIQSMSGVIFEASDIWRVKDRKGRLLNKAILHIKKEFADSPDEEPEGKAIYVSGDLCNYVGCIGARVKVEYFERVFSFIRNGVHLFGNEYFARTIKRV